MANFLNERRQKLSSEKSSFRENMLMHVFVGDLLKELWFRYEKTGSVLFAEVDDAGYDLVVEVEDIVRHIQLKSSTSKPKVSVSTLLCNKPAGCVVFMVFKDSKEPSKLQIDYHFFGGGPKEPLPSLDNFDQAIHPVTKKPRRASKAIPGSRFKKVGEIRQLVDTLFGPTPIP